MVKIGELGENFVGQWLESRGYFILHYRWRCRWGEIDIIARNDTESILIFVEVKTRSKNNWDEDGLLAITPKKQEKIQLTVAMFLSENEDLANFACRFDVALVHYQVKKISPINSSINENYQFRLVNYLESAF